MPAIPFAMIAQMVLGQMQKQQQEREARRQAALSQLTGGRFQAQPPPQQDFSQIAGLLGQLFEQRGGGFGGLLGGDTRQQAGLAGRNLFGRFL